MSRADDKKRFSGTRFGAAHAGRLAVFRFGLRQGEDGTHMTVVIQAQRSLNGLGSGISSSASMAANLSRRCWYWALTTSMRGPLSRPRSSDFDALRFLHEDHRDSELD